jgi:GcrA cell cycle regulator
VIGKAHPPRPFSRGTSREAERAVAASSRRRKSALPPPRRPPPRCGQPQPSSRSRRQAAGRPGAGRARRARAAEWSPSGQGASSARAPATSSRRSPRPAAPPGAGKPSAEVADKTSLLDLNEKICKWAAGPSRRARFPLLAAQPANPGFPYCVDHCGVAYRRSSRRDRRPPPPLPFGGPRIR